MQPPERSGRFALPRWLKALLLVGAVSLIPAAAEAHGLIGAGGWVDELVCLVPAAIMIVLVLVLGRSSKATAKKKDAA
ncbi:MAG TPA: hypothetical protein VKT80_00985 [Chloroflexota bacterium]|nr:hypothetical protein [Chloroflexota bacterium]